MLPPDYVVYNLQVQNSISVFAVLFSRATAGSITSVAKFLLQSPDVYYAGGGGGLSTLLCCCSVGS